MNKETVNVLKTYTYTAQKNFRGFKRIYVASYPVKKYMKAADALAAKRPDNFSGLQVNLNVVQIENENGNYNAIRVVIDGSVVGTIWEDNQYYKAVRDGLVKEVYARCDQKIVVGKGKSETRNQVMLFARM